MTALLSMLAAKATPYLIGGGAILAVWLLTILKAVLWARSTERNAQKAKEAKARDEEIARIKQAAGAKPSGSLSDDPNNRDNRPT